jgi:VanZ family protein
MISADRNGRVSNQEIGSGGPTEGGHFRKGRMTRKCDVSGMRHQGQCAYSERTEEVDLQAEPAKDSRNQNRVMVRIALAWFVLAVIIVLSLVPPGFRPATFMPHKIEHASIFLLDGIAFGIAYCGYERFLSIGAVIFCATIELAQLTIPGRHARLSDFFVDAVAICVGIVVGSALIRMRRRPHRKAIVGHPC